MEKNEVNKNDISKKDDKEVNIQAFSHEPVTIWRRNK